VVYHEQFLSRVHKVVAEGVPHGEVYATSFTAQPDFAKIAEACNCYGQRVEKPEDIKEACRNALKANKEGVPAVLDFIVDPTESTPGENEFGKMCKTVKYRFS